jgi:hypothetical protein
VDGRKRRQIAGRKTNDETPFLRAPKEQSEKVPNERRKKNGRRKSMIQYI